MGEKEQIRKYSERTKKRERKRMAHALGTGVVICVALLMLFFLPVHVVFAQTEPLSFYLENPNYTGETRYVWADGKRDKIYVSFLAPGASLQLKAKRADGLVSDLTLAHFETDGWTKEFKPIGTVSAAEHDFVINESGGYQLQSKLGGVTLTRTLWVFYDDIALSKLRSTSKCDALTLVPVFNYDADAIRNDKFLYYDLTIADVSQIQDFGASYFKTVNWFNLQGAPVEVYGPAPRPLTPPPYEKIGYKVEMESITGKKFTAATPELVPVAVKAKMKIEINKDLDGITEQWQDGGETPEGECPFFMRMKNESLNATQLHWSVRNDLRAVRRGKQDTLFYQMTGAATSEEVRPSSDLYTAGLYRVELRAVNELSGCQDTARINVKVDSALLAKNAIPNVFSPNGDGINDIFQIIERAKNAKSLKSFEVHIMNRNGTVVYEYKGDIRKWEGWNGRKNGKGEPLAVGTYFYVIRAVGWDGVEFAGKEYKGVLQLYR